MLDSEKNRIVPWLYSHARFYDFMMGLLGYARARKEILLSVPVSIPRNACILDLGCGTGVTTGPLLERFPHARVTAIDYSANMLQQYQKRFPHVPTIVGDFNDKQTWRWYSENKKVQLRPATFDLVVSTGALSEYGDFSRVIPLLSSLLKKDGYLVNIGIKNNWLGRLAGLLWGFQPKGIEELITAYDKAGFSSVLEYNIQWRLWSARLMNYVVLAKK